LDERRFLMIKVHEIIMNGDKSELRTRMINPRYIITIERVYMKQEMLPEGLNKGHEFSHIKYQNGSDCETICVLGSVLSIGEILERKEKSLLFG